MASTNNIPQKRSRRIAEQSSSHQQGERCTSTSNSSNDDDDEEDNHHDEDKPEAAAMSTSPEQTTSHGTDAATASGAAVAPVMILCRFRAPHDHDVVCGRGGAINSHIGNVQFRNFVHERRARYALTSNKVEKQCVAQEVIDFVRGQQPPGRFLQKDPASGKSRSSAGDAIQWWVELDEDKVMAKTCQALREGATQIRAAHGIVVLDEQRALSGRRKSQKPAVTTPPHQQQPLAISSAPGTLVSSVTAPTAVNNIISSPVRPSQSGRKRIHSDRQNVAPSLHQQHQHQPQRQRLLKVAFLSSPEELNRQAAISQLRVNVEEAKRRYHDPMQARQQQTGTTRSLYPAPVAARAATTAAAAVAAATMDDPVAKRVRVEYGSTAVFPTDAATPPLMAADVAEHKLDALPHLNLSHDTQRAAAAATTTTTTNQVKRRSHSFSLSDNTSPTEDWATGDFVNPFEQDAAPPPDALNTSHTHHHAAILHQHLPIGKVDSSSSPRHQQRPHTGVYNEEESLSRTDQHHRHRRHHHHHHHHAAILHHLPVLGAVDSSLSPWHHQSFGVYDEEVSRIGATTSSDEDDLAALGALLQAPTPAAAESVAQSAPTPPNTGIKASSASTPPQSAAAADASPRAWVRVRSNLSSRSLTSLLSDLPDEFNSKPLETEFSQGMKEIFDALHQD